MLTHAYKKAILEASAPECEKTGLTEGEKCSECGFVLIADRHIASEKSMPMNKPRVKCFQWKHGIPMDSN